MKSLWIAGGLAASVVSAFAQAGAGAVSSSAENGSLKVPYAKPGPAISDTLSAAEARDIAQYALANGFPEAVGYFQAALAKPGLDDATRDTLNLGLATALLSQGKLVDATAALQEVSSAGTHSPAYLLRIAMLAARNQKWDEAKAQADQVGPEALAPGDLPWYFALKAMLAEQNHDVDGAVKAWTQARDSSTTQMQKSQFDFALSWAKNSLMGDATLADAEALRLKAETMLPTVGVGFIPLYAVELNKLGQRAQALMVLKTWLGKSGLSSLKLDALRLAYASIDNDDPQRPNAALDQRYLLEILKDRLEPGTVESDKANLVETLQKPALALLEIMLFGGAQPPSVDLHDSTPLLDTAALLKNINDLLDSQPNHPLLKQLLLLQAQLALSLNHNDDATKAANALLALPADTGRDPAREEAWWLLSFIFGQAHQYFSAAENLSNLLNALPTNDPNRKELTLRMADAYFLKGDYSRSAGYYTSLFNDPKPPPPGPGVLLLRAVESDIRAEPEQLNDALSLLTAAGTRGDLDDAYTTNRWQAEFNVLTKLAEVGREKDAFDRIQRLLSHEHGVDLLSPGLLVRLLWLDADLAVTLVDPDAAKKAATLQQMIEKLPPGELTNLDVATRRHLAASALYLQYVAAGNDQKLQDKEDFYNKLLEAYPDSDEAITAVIGRANELELQSQTLKAQQLMTDLAKRLPDNSIWLPTVRYQEAQFVADRGSSDQYKEALDLLKIFVQKYPDSPLVYKALLLEADLLCKLDSPEDLDRALQIYNNLLSNPPGKPNDLDAAAAAMGKVKCLTILAGSDADKRKIATDELERLFNLEKFPVDARAEAGFSWGTLLENNPNGDHAKNLEDASNAYTQVASMFLSNPALLSELRKTIYGCTWLSDALAHWAENYYTQKKYTQAYHCYQLIIDNDLPNKELALSRQKDLANAITATAPAAEPPTPPPPSPVPAPSDATSASATSTPAAPAPTDAPVVPATVN